ncbi:MAG: TetR/AcrR family transcriptional regulator [Desulfatibacillum sp.]|nr:TetR/AcrR family transcriptional regulator [Desulfatibacillum sp.]
MREELRIERKNKLLQAAARVFSEKGYAGTTISDVAARAGMGKGTVYGYFSSKEELFFDLFFWYAREVMAGVSLDLLSGEESVKDSFLKFTQELVERMLLSIDMYPLTLEFWSAAASGGLRDRMKNAMAEMYDEYRGLIAGVIHHGIERKEFRPETNVQALSAGIMGALDALGLQYWMNPDFDIKAAATETVSAILTGISFSSEFPNKG